MTAKPSYLFPLLIVTTIFNVISIAILGLGSLVATFAFSAMTTDAPGAEYVFQREMAIPLLLLALGMPVILTAAQWIFYVRAWWRTSLVLSLLALFPAFGTVARMFGM